MAVEFLIALLLLTALLSGVAGYAFARRSAPKRSDLEALQRELETAEQRAQDVQTNVTGHFEQSAMLFGQLARDYRAFLEHFSESAQSLGISEVKARELLARADQPLLGQRDDVIDGESMAAAAETAVAEAAADEPAAAEPAVDEPAPTLEGTTPAEDPDATEAPSTRDTVAADASAPAADPAEPEPPLMEDVVLPSGQRPRVVDVEVDALGLPIDDADGKRAGGQSRRS